MGGGLKHGTTTGYSRGCRCLPCKHAHYVYGKNYRERNRERFREQRRAEYAKNPDRFARLTRERNQKQRAILLRYRVWCGCRRCGYRENGRALEFHHRDPSLKEFNVSESYGKAWARIKAEVRKCEVLCSNCHKIEEAELRWGT